MIQRDRLFCLLTARMAVASASAADVSLSVAPERVLNQIDEKERYPLRCRRFPAALSKSDIRED